MIGSIILTLYLLGLVAAPQAAIFLCATGILLIIGEIVFTTGILAINGALALYAAYTIQYGDSMMFGMKFGWQILFGIAFVELLILIALGIILTRLRRHKVTTGTESMIGQTATIIEWNDKAGLVRINGEIWKAQSEQALTAKPDDMVTVEKIDGLVLKVTKEVI
jgi:membrane-bound serine protease (ClpP class)